MVAAKPGSTPKLTPELLQRAVDCRAAHAMSALFPVVMGDAMPKWLSKNEAESSVGLYVYDLKPPITVQGQRRSQLALHQQWISVVLPADTNVQALADTLNLERAPFETALQYYRFLGPDGPMLSVYQVLANPLDAINPSDLANAKKKLLLGCNYTPMTKAEFLEVSGQADAMLKEIAKTLRAKTKDLDAPRKP